VQFSKWHRMLPILVTVFVLVPLLSTERGFTQDKLVLCVAPDGDPQASGACWDDPLDFAGAMAQAEPGMQVWLQQGTYVAGPDSHSAFYLSDGVELIGGFTGSSEDASEREHDAAATVLDGEADRYTVLISAGVADATVSTLTVANGAATLIADEATDLQRRGGGVYVSNSNVSFENVVIRDNRARFGGAGLYVDEPSDLVLTNVVFRDNKTTHPQSGRGGGVRIQSGSISITDSHFEDNKAVRGGAVFVDNGDVSIYRSEFVRNDATDYGGGISIYAGSLSIDDSGFRDNLAITEGGGVYAARSTDAVSISDSEFSENRAGSGGGAGWLQASDMTIERSSFLENSAGAGSGGGIYLSDSTSQLHNLRIQGNQAGRGGGLSLHNSDVELINSLITGNLSRPVDLMLDYDESRIGQDASADGAGGGLAISGNGSTTITNATVAANRSTGTGLGIAYSGVSDFELGNSILFGNRQLGEESGEPSLSIDATDQEQLPSFQIAQSILEDGCPDDLLVSCDGVTRDDPRFRELPEQISAPTSGGDFRLWFTSPAIDAGRDDLLAGRISTDLAGEERRIRKLPDSSQLQWSGLIDLGAFEAPIPEPEPDTEIVIGHSRNDQIIEIDARTDADGHLRGIVEVQTSEVSIEAFRAGRLYVDGDHIVLDGEALLPNGALAGIIVEIEPSAESSSPERFRIVLDTGASTGWIDHE
jgi:hypothetical protein